MPKDKCKANYLSITSDDLTEEWQVSSPGCWENDEGPFGWWAVSNNEGIVAYFGKEIDAFKYRWDKITENMFKE